MTLTVSTGLRSALVALVLVLSTAALIIDYTGEEPFWCMFRIRDAFLYLGVGSALLVCWGVIVFRVGQALRRHKSLANGLLLLGAVVGTWFATWCPSEYVKDMSRLDEGGCRQTHERLSKTAAVLGARAK
jgi:hypothetical protein